MSDSREYNWDELLRQIPGYDPFKDAGDCWFDEESAQRALDFFEHPTDYMLVHVKGKKAGQPFILEDWERAIIANMFGWKRPDGTRRFRHVFVYVPRKNGKTALAAGVICVLLYTDGEPGAEIYSAAAESEQAALVFGAVKEMVLHEPMLDGASQIYRKAIVVGSSSYKAISADAASKHGYNSHGIVIDELHAQPNRELVDVLLTSTGAREQPLVFYITTADYDRPSICNEKYDYACKVRDGVVQDQEFLPVIYEALRSDDWKSPDTWRKANPNLGVSIPLEYFEKECKKAQEMPSYENTFKRLHLNMKTEQDIRWLPIDKWDENSKEIFTYGDLIGQECFAGLDLASSIDLAAFVMIFPDAGNKVLCKFWCPEQAIQSRTRKSRLPYLDWAKRGFITSTPGNVIDYDIIRADIQKLSEDFKIREIAYDRWGATQLSTQLTGDGFEMVPFGQGFASMSPPSKELEALLNGHNLPHGGNPVLRWMAGNVAAEIDAAGNIKPCRKKSTEKIDGIVALIMSIGRMIVDTGKRGSVYDHRGIHTL